jgi:hypothetical protein
MESPRKVPEVGLTVLFESAQRPPDPQSIKTDIHCAFCNDVPEDPNAVKGFDEPEVKNDLHDKCISWVARMRLPRVPPPVFDKFSL